MTSQADNALAKLRRIAKQRQEEPHLIAEALEAGARVTDIAEAAGRTREHIRRIGVAAREGKLPKRP